MKLLVMFVVLTFGLLVPASTVCYGCLGICGSKWDCGPGCACITTGGVGVCADSAVVE